MERECKTVLIADDEADVRVFVRTALEQDDVKVVEAVNGKEAVLTAKKLLPDLVILDVQMPEQDGFETFGDLRRDAATQKIPVIMLTAVAERTGFAFDGDDMKEFLGSKPEAYLDKPVDPDALQKKARELLGLADA